MNNFTYFENYIKNLDIDLAHLEQLGVILLIAGYSQYFIGAEYSIEDALGTNFTNQSPEFITLKGQELVLMGYTFLWYVAGKRYDEKVLQKNNEDPTINLVPYRKILDSYFLSIIANELRLEAFAEIVNEDTTGPFIE